MRVVFWLAAAIAALVAACPTGVAAETPLFNGKDLSGWAFHPEDEEAAKVEAPWVVERGMLVCRGLAPGFLIHDKTWEDYVLTFEIRTMSTEEGNGVAVGSLGSVYLNASPEKGAFGAPKSVELSLRDTGNVFLRDIDNENVHNTDAWVHRAPGFARDVERDMGQWNNVRVMCHGERLTVIVNNRIVNQVEPIHPVKGAVALKSQRGFMPAPTYYRNIVVRPIGPADVKYEQQVTASFAKATAAIARKKAAEQAEQARVEQMQAAAQEKLAQELADVPVAADVDVVAEARRLPFPADARNIEFSAVFGDIEFESPSSLAQLTRFYTTEMAKRGWQATASDVDEDEVTITFQHGDAEVEVNLDESPDGVDVSMDTEELSFEGTDDPASLAKLGVPQPQAYLVLQREFAAPEGYRDQEYDLGERRLFKSTLPLPELYEFLTAQLRQKGYRETRRPIISDDRRYSEFAKGGVELSVNAFAHEIGSRVVLTYEAE
ncbi:MAG: hypothetical protein CMJ58_19195 [Planctomycetaceae bacterium]|nr:hypothetical protein [Planctomycetaceae bacterium]